MKAVCHEFFKSRNKIKDFQGLECGGEGLALGVSDLHTLNHLY